MRTAMNPVYVAHVQPPAPIPTFSLFSSVSGPAASTSYFGAITVGVAFKVTSSGLSLRGFNWWVADANQSVAAQNFGLWTVTSVSAGSFVAGSAVSSGVLSIGQWNYVPYLTPVPLTSGTEYKAVTGFSNYFPFTGNQFGGFPEPYYAGITSGPLFAYSDSSGTTPDPFGGAQGSFGTAGSDPTVNYPSTGSSSGNFWIDVAVG